LAEWQEIKRLTVPERQEQADFQPFPAAMTRSANLAARRSFHAYPVNADTLHMEWVSLDPTAEVGG
jgi:hypothetical protein